MRFIRKQLSREILAVLIASVGVIMTIVTVMTVSNQTKDMVRQMTIFGDELATTIFGSMKYSMAIGDSKAVNKQLADIQANIRDVEVYIYSSNKTVSYSTAEDAINSTVTDLINSQAAKNALNEALSNGKHPGAYEDRAENNRFLLTIYPILNQKECNHCHGSTRKVLGGMLVRLSADRTYADISRQQNRLVLLTVIGVCAIIAIVYGLIFELITKPLNILASFMKELPEKLARGEAPAAAGVTRTDEIGTLTGSFNQMATDLHEKDKAIKQAYKDITSANKELEAFAYSVSHDLRAPLRNIDGFSKILLEDYTDQLDSRGKHYLTRVRNGTAKMSTLIDDILSFSRIGRTELQLKKVDCNTLVNDTLRDFVAVIKEKDVEIKVGELPLINCDYAMIKNVFANLISNCIKFTAGVENPKIVIAYDRKNKVISVQDNGIGFDMLYHDKIFQVFQRLHLPEEYEGTGIGLAVVKRTVEKHSGGSIWAESRPGEGATFFIKLPVLEVHDNNVVQEKTADKTESLKK